MNQKYFSPLCMARVYFNRCRYGALREIALRLEAANTPEALPTRLYWQEVQSYFLGLGRLNA